MDFKMELEVPTLTDVSFQGIETYIDTLKRAKEYGKMKDKEIIFYSLMKSKRTGLFNDMQLGDDENIDKFGAFIRMIYGVDKEFLLQQYKQAKQDEGENALRFYNRIVKLFYKIRDMDVPQKIEDKIYKLEMTQVFLQGLRNREVSRLLARNRKQIDFEDLGQTAYDYEIVEDQKWE